MPVNNLFCKKLHVLCFIGEQIRVWFDGMRSQYGRITTKKSGQGAPELMKHDKFVLKHFVFLEGHIIRQKHTTRGPVSGTFELYIRLPYLHFLTIFFVHDSIWCTE